ncbi:unnamed protein product [Cylicocyclus nassatus]|uniref:Uncharacterized protein n=1 Tax=Cylicocyclus nassatus TaxID=53992 RepID=A0AA36GSJ4_CYLNA|nr:unnamed protein product [Cylicocyclus nassatus]
MHGKIVPNVRLLPLQPPKKSKRKAAKETSLDLRYSILDQYDIARHIQNYHVDLKKLEKVDKLSVLLENLIRQANESVTIALTQRRARRKLSQINETLYKTSSHLLNFRRMQKQVLQKMNLMLLPTSRHKLTMSLRRHQKHLHNHAVMAISNLFTVLVDFTPRCGSLMRIWDGLGTFVCNGIAAPAQGLWVATMFCALGSAAIYHAFFNTARFWKDAMHDEYAKRRLEKVKYVQKALKLERLSHSSSSSETTKRADSYSKPTSRPSTSVTTKSASRSPKGHYDAATVEAKQSLIPKSKDKSREKEDIEEGKEDNEEGKKATANPLSTNSKERTINASAPAKSSEEPTQSKEMPTNAAVRVSAENAAKSQSSNSQTDLRKSKEEVRSRESIEQPEKKKTLNSSKKSLQTGIPAFEKVAVRTSKEQVSSKNSKERVGSESKSKEFLDQGKAGNGSHIVFSQLHQT